jgi:hypothetical protein
MKSSPPTPPAIPPEASVSLYTLRRHRTGLPSSRSGCALVIDRKNIADIQTVLRPCLYARQRSLENRRMRPAQSRMRSARPRSRCPRQRKQTAHSQTCQHSNCVALWLPKAWTKLNVRIRSSSLRPWRLFFVIFAVKMFSPCVPRSNPRGLLLVTQSPKKCKISHRTLAEVQSTRSTLKGKPACSF